MGLIDSKTDGNENVTTYGYDELNRLLSVSNDTDAWVDYQYDRNGNVISMRISFYDAITDTVYVFSETLYEYNVANQLVRSIKDGGRTGTSGNYTYDLSKVQSYTYEVDGQPAIKTDRNGNTTAYSYDIHGNLLSQTVTSASVGLHLLQERVLVRLS